MDSRRVLVVTDKMANVNRIYNWLKNRCLIGSSNTISVLSLPSGYTVKGIDNNNVSIDVTIMAVSNADSEEYKTNIIYDRVIVDSVFNYNGSDNVIKAFEKSCKNLYNVIEIDLSEVG